MAMDPLQNHPASMADRSISPAATKCLHQINRRDVIINLLVWISGILEKRS
jgi:hypothetical protein